ATSAGISSHSRPLIRKNTNAATPRRRHSGRTGHLALRGSVMGGTRVGTLFASCLDALCLMPSSPSNLLRSAPNGFDTEAGTRHEGTRRRSRADTLGPYALRDDHGGRGRHAALADEPL